MAMVSPAICVYRALYEHLSPATPPQWCPNPPRGVDLGKIAVVSPVISVHRAHYEHLQPDTMALVSALTPQTTFAIPGYQHDLAVDKDLGDTEQRFRYPGIAEVV